MSGRPLVGPADVLRAWAALAEDESTRLRIAAMLGFSLVPARRGGHLRQETGQRPPHAGSRRVLLTDTGDLSDGSPRGEPHFAPWAIEQAGMSETKEPSGSAERSLSRALHAQRQSPSQPRDQPAGGTLFSSSASTAPGRRRWTQLRPLGLELTTAAGSALAASMEEETLLPRSGAPSMPLLAPIIAPSIIAALVSTDSGDGELDTDELVSTLARRLIPSGLPRRTRPSLLHGVLILVDRGESMIPFRADCTEIAARVQRVVGRDASRLVYFADSPLRGAGLGPRWTWSRFQCPRAGTSVLVISDLGAGGPAYHNRRSQPEEWIAFARLLRQNESNLTALVPYPRHRVDGRIATAVPVVHWDRGLRLPAVMAARSFPHRRILR
jgi:hypothetical protein